MNLNQRDIKYNKELQYREQKIAGSGWCAKKLKTSFFETESRRAATLDEIHDIM
jgi:hypothetical protein